MAQPVIERLEAAVAACDSMEERTRSAKELLPDLLARSRELADTVESAGPAAREAIDRARTTVVETRSRLEATAGEVHAQLQALAAAARALAEEASTLLQGMGVKLAEVAAARDGLLAALRSGVELTQSECEEIGTRLEALGGEVSAGAATATERIAALRTAVDEVRGSLGEAQQRWGEAMAALRSAAATEAQDVDTRAMAFVQEFGTLVNDAAEGVVDDHNAALSAMWEGFVDHAGERIAAALEATGEPLAAGDALCGEQSETLAASGRLVTDLIQGLARVLSELGAGAGQSASRVPR
jgi:chromosome segregation ATPase